MLLKNILSASRCIFKNGLFEFFFFQKYDFKPNERNISLQDSSLRLSNNLDSTINLVYCDKIGLTG